MPSKIEWTGESWNPIRARELDKIGWHCEHASPGCQNCYAETQNVAQRFDLGTGLPYKPGHRKDVEIYLDEAALVKPLSWKKGRKVFVCSMTDLFADFVTDAMIDRIFAVMALCPQHTFQVLTKRSGRMREYVTGASCDGARRFHVQDAAFKVADWFNDDVEHWPLPNVWLGVSVEDQQRADERIPDLLATPAAVRWISAEPLLGPVSIIDAMWARDGNDLTATIDWVVVGGESGSKARPMHPDWARALRDQCAAAGVPFFFKQWGEWYPAFANDYVIDAAGVREIRDIEGAVVHRLGKKRGGRLLDGVQHDGMPE